MPSPSTRPTTTLQRGELSSGLVALGLHHTAAELDDLLARATKGRFGPQILLEEIVRAEQRDRERRSLERRLRNARLGRFKPIADFDWNWPTEIDREAIERLLTAEFVPHGDNVVLAAAQGLGKTTIARNIGYHAVLGGYSVRFLTAAQLVLDLASQDGARALDRRLRHYTRPALLGIDEIGYLSLDARAADLLFEVVSRRYEHRSLIVTTNLAFADWPSIFPNSSCVTALIDRLTHHAEVLSIQGESYRRREAEERQRNRKTS